MRSVSIRKINHHFRYCCELIIYLYWCNIYCISAPVAFLRTNVDVFAWQPSDIPGVPREVIEHHLAVCPHARPVKQKVRKQALERQQFIAEEIKKLEAAGLVRGVMYPTWLANPVVVHKANGDRKSVV